MDTVWIYEAYEVEDYVVHTEVKVFKDEKSARKFWKKRKKEILNTSDVDYWKIETKKDKVLIYDKENPSEFCWEYSIKEYPIENIN